MTDLEAQNVLLSGIFIVYPVLIVSIIVFGLWKIWFKFRIVRKVWQITNPKYRGIPIDTGNRREPHF